jgi:hypothetical protein
MMAREPGVRPHTSQRFTNSAFLSLHPGFVAFYTRSQLPRRKEFDMRHAVLAGVLLAASAASSFAQQCQTIPQPLLSASLAEQARYQSDVLACLAREMRAIQSQQPTGADVSIYRGLQPPPPVDALGAAIQAQRLGLLQNQRRALRAQAEANYPVYAAAKGAQLRELLSAAPDLRGPILSAAEQFRTAKDQHDWDKTAKLLAKQRIPRAAIDFLGAIAAPAYYTPGANARFSSELSWRILMAQNGATDSR